MKTHATTIGCPFCGGDAALTTEWGWVDDKTCTATLCCPICRTETAHSDDACACAHVERYDGEDPADTEQRAIAEAMLVGLPA